MLGTGWAIKKLFSIAGFDITPGKLIKGGLMIAAVALVYFGYRMIDNHFDHIRSLENENTQLTRENESLEDELNDVVEINQHNEQVNETAAEQRDSSKQIANSESQKATTRAMKHKEINDAIEDSEPSGDPVDPVILDTLDSLWG